MNDKYILQYGSLAGWPFKIANALRNKGLNSENIVLYDRDVIDLSRKLPFDRALCNFNDPAWKKGLAIFKYIYEVANTVDLIHYHSGSIFVRQFHHLLEGPLFSREKIPMLLSFGGSDARLISQARKNNPYFYLEENAKYDDKIKRNLESMSKHIKFCATDYEMLGYTSDYFEKSFVFRQPVNLDEIECSYPCLENKVPVVLHAPTNPEVKGTKYVEAAIERLKAEGHSFEYKFVRQLTQQEMYREIAKADIYVDELRVGCHGVTAVETMAAGKPTLTYIREDLIDRFPEDLPIVNVNPDTLYIKLKELLEDVKLRNETGQASRRYVEKYHDVKVVCDDLIQIYKEIGL